MSCDYLVTWAKDGDKYNFEMKVAAVEGYAALGIAPEPAMVGYGTIHIIKYVRDATKSKQSRDLHAHCHKSQYGKIREKSNIKALNILQCYLITPGLLSFM